MQGLLDEREVTAVEAARLIGRSERTVRQWIVVGLRTLGEGSARCKLDAYKTATGFRVRLGDLRAYAERLSIHVDWGTVSASDDGSLRALESRIADLESRVRALPRLPSAFPTVPAPDRFVAPQAAQRTVEQGVFATRADAARWLQRHGIAASTPKSWDGWQYVPLTPNAMLTDALARLAAARARGNWRVRWQVTPCDDSACVCHQQGQLS